MWLRTLVLFCALGVFVQCELDRRDVHRIVLKPDRKKTHKKHHKHHRSKGYQKGHHHHRNVDYEPSAHATGYNSAEAYYYEKPHYTPHHRYHNHHEEYHELMNPRPPKIEDYTGYPEEEHVFNYQQASNTHYQKETADSWTPVPIPTKHIVQKPHHNYGGSSKKAPRRKSTIKPPALADMIDLTTIKPRKYPIPLITSQSFQHYINHENKSQPKYGFGIQNDKGTSENSYEVHEDYVEVKTPVPTTFNGLSPILDSYHNNLKSTPHFTHTSPSSISFNSYKNPDYGKRTHPSLIKKFH